MEKKNVFILIILVSFFSLNLFSLPQTSDGKSPFVQVIKNVRESVVNIKVEGEEKATFGNQSPFGNDDFFKFFAPQMPETRKYATSGSGFIFKRTKDEVYIMTNNHVVAKAKAKDFKITVNLADKNKYPAEIVGLDSQSDLAVIKITVPKDEKIVMVSFGDSDILDIGDWAIAIGNPFSEGLERTVTVGVISAVGRSNLNFGNDSPEYQDYIQTDAAINPGNSGGPLLNLKGEVIGVNAAITSTSGGSNGIGFAIPANIAKKVANDLLDGGKVVRAYLGILPQEITSDLRKSLDLKETSGVLIAKVEANTPAEKAGLKNGDVITEIEGQKVPNVSKFRLTIANYNVGQDINIKVMRDSKEVTIKAKLEERPSDRVAANFNTKGSIWLGLKVDKIDGDLGKKMQIKAETGVVITSVEAGSVAEKANLKAGDVILEVNKQKIKDLDTYDKVMDDVQKKIEKSDNKVILLYIQTKDNNFQYIPLTVD